jgi:broad specificity phosphatase PhoE
VTKIPSHDPIRFLFFRHGQMESHRGDLPLTPAGVGQAEAAGERLAEHLDPGTHVEFISSPTRRARGTAEGIRRGLERSVNGDVALGTPRVEQAIRNGDIYLAGIRIELVKSAEAVAEQLPPGLMSIDQIERHDFLHGFWTAADPIGFWLNAPSPPGERASDVARRFLDYARSACDVQSDAPRLFVCATHSGVLRSLVRHQLGADDPGEPEYVESVQLGLAPDGTATWRFRDTVVTTPA